MTDEELDVAIAKANDDLDEVGCNTELTQWQSVSFYVAVIDHCQQWKRTIEAEMG